MVEFLGEKKGTPVNDYSTINLRFCYLFQDATIPHMSNFRVKDVDDMSKPDLETVKQKMINDMIKEPQEPARPVIPTQLPRTWDSVEHLPPWGYRGNSRLQDKWDREKVQRERLNVQVNRVTTDYEKKKQIYKKEKEEYDRKLKEILNEVRVMAKKSYELLKTEWEEHQKIMNQFLALEDMAFEINYCDVDNKKYFAAQKKAAEASLAAEKIAKAEEFVDEIIQSRREAKKAAVEKAHDEKLQKRVEYLFRYVDLHVPSSSAKYKSFRTWGDLKPKLERVKRLMDKAKADRLGADIQKKDDAITKLAEYDLDLDDLDAAIHMSDNPFFKDATAEIKIPD
jgi:hypothetical protein